MPSTKRPWIKKWVLFGLALAIAGCAQLERQVPISDSVAQPETSAEESFQPLPDPYKTQHKSVPLHARTLFEQAHRAMQAENWPQARSILEQLVQSYPELSGPYVNLGLVYREQGELDKAVRAFEQAIAANRLNSEAYNQLAILHRERGEFEQAEKRYRQALEVWPHNPVVHRNLAILYDLYMGRLAEALHHYKMSQKVAPEPDRQLEGWIVDLERRLADQQTAANRAE